MKAHRGGQHGEDGLAEVEYNLMSGEENHDRLEINLHQNAISCMAHLVMPQFPAYLPEYSHDIPVTFP